MIYPKYLDKACFFTSYSEEMSNNITKLPLEWTPVSDMLIGISYNNKKIEINE